MLEEAGSGRRRSARVAQQLAKYLITLNFGPGAAGRHWVVSLNTGRPFPLHLESFSCILLGWHALAMGLQAPAAAYEPRPNRRLLDC
jgi:hypothetical protein